MRKAHYFLTCVVACLLFLGIPQGVKAEENVNLDIFGEVIETYDDNILYDPDNEIDDLITTVLVGLGIEHVTKTQSFRLSGSIEQNLFADFDTFNNTAEYIDLEFEKEYSDLNKISVKNNFEHAEAPDSFEESIGRQLGRYEFFNNEFEVEYTRELDMKRSYSLGYANEVYDASRDDIPDSVDHRVLTAYNYQRDPANTYSANYEFEYTAYDNDENSNTHKLFGSWQHLFDKRKGVRMDLGTSVIDSFDDDVTAKPYAMFRYNNEIAEDTMFIFTVKKEYEPSNFRSDIFDLLLVSAQVIKQLSDRWTLKARGFFGLGEYLASNIEDELAGADAGVEFEVRENFKLFMNYRFETNNSNLASRDYEKNRVSLGVQVSF